MHHTICSLHEMLGMSEFESPYMFQVMLRVSDVDPQPISVGSRCHAVSGMHEISTAELPIEMPRFRVYELWHRSGLLIQIGRSLRQASG